MPRPDEDQDKDVLSLTDPAPAVLDHGIFHCQQDSRDSIAEQDFSLGSITAIPSDADEPLPQPFLVAVLSSDGLAD